MGWGNVLTGSSPIAIGNRHRELRRGFTAEADGSVVSGGMIFFSGKLTGIGFIPDETTPPNALTVNLTDRDGLAVIPPALFPATGGRVAITPPQNIIDGATPALSGNSIAAAKGTIVLYID